MIDTAWMNCYASCGQFCDEVAVRGIDYLGHEFSLFVASRFIQSNNLSDKEIPTQLEVKVLDTDGLLSLIMLPEQTFEHGAYVTVESNKLNNTAIVA